MMSLQKFYLFCLFLLGIACGSSRANPVDWHSALKIAFGENPDLKQAEYEFEAKKSQLKASYGSWSPTADFEIQKVYQDSGELPGTGTLSLSQNLFRGFADQAQTRAALIQLKIAELKYENQKVKVVGKLLDLFSSEYFIRKEIDYLQKLLKIQSDVAQVTQKRVRIGAEPDILGLSAESQQQIAQAQVLEKQLELENHKNKVSEYMGFTSPELLPLKLDRSFVEKLAIYLENYLTKQSDRVESYDAHVLKLQLDLAKQQATFDRSPFLPSLNAGGAFQMTESSRAVESSVFVELSVPLFRGFKSYFKNKSSEWEILKLEKQCQTQNQKDILSKKLFFSQLKTQLEILRRLDQANSSNQKAQQRAAQMYSLGTLSYVSFADIQRRATETELQFQRKMATSLDLLIESLAKWGWESSVLVKDLNEMI